MISSEISNNQHSAYVQSSHEDGDFFTIHVASSLLQRDWTPRQVTWESFKRQLTDPANIRRTIETRSELTERVRASLPPDAGEAIISEAVSKAVNKAKSRTARPFFSGSLRQLDGEYRRMKKTVDSRWHLTLDVEGCSTDVLDRMKELPLDGFLYSTFRHTAESPRFRLILRTTRAMTPDEFEIVTKEFCECNFADFQGDWNQWIDSCSWKTAQAMLGPAGFADSEVIQHVLNGDPIDPDEYLKLAHERELQKKSEEKSAKATRRAQRSHEKRGERLESRKDPRTLRGIRGAFNSTYDVRTAISTFLNDVMIPEGDRYRLADADSDAGIVVFDHSGSPAFTFSHHTNHPYSGKAYDAFDTVRLYKFGHLDASAPAGTKDKRLPSWKKMIELCRDDEKVSWPVESSWFQDSPPRIFAEHEPWMDELYLYEDTQWARASEADNIGLILDNDPVLRGAFGLNTMTGEVNVIRDLPWSRPSESDVKKSMQVPYTVSDEDLGNVQRYINRNYVKGRLGIRELSTYIRTASLRFSFSPIQQFIENLPPWDGKPRIETMLQTYLGAPDDALTREASEKFMVGMVNRCYKPGCYFEYTLILHGPQRMGKSRFLRALGGDFFSDPAIESLGDKDALRILNRSVLIEFAELETFLNSRNSAGKIKGFLSRREDTFRLPYAINPIDLPRHFVCAGTSNDTSYLRDNTGNRRFWCIHLDGHTRFRTMDEEDRLQIWAEATALYNSGIVDYDENGKFYYELSDEANRINEAVQSGALVDAGLEGDVRSLIEMMVPGDWETRTLDDWVRFCSARPREEYPSYQAAKGRTAHGFDNSQIPALIPRFGSYVTDYEPEAVREFIELWGDISLDADIDLDSVAPGTPVNHPQCAFPFPDTRLYPQTRIDAQQISECLKSKYRDSGLRSKVGNIMSHILESPESEWTATGAKKQQHGKTLAGGRRILAGYRRDAAIGGSVDRRVPIGAEEKLNVIPVEQEELSPKAEVKETVGTEQENVVASASEKSDSEQSLSTDVKEEQTAKAVSEIPAAQVVSHEVDIEKNDAGVQEKPRCAHESYAPQTERHRAITKRAKPLDERYSRSYIMHSAQRAADGGEYKYAEYATQQEAMVEIELE